MWQLANARPAVSADDATVAWRYQAIADDARDREEEIGGRRRRRTDVGKRACEA